MSKSFYSNSARCALSSATAETFINLPNLADSALGAEVLFATDEWFAGAERMLLASDAEFRVGVFTEFGKWMDGWESRRRRTPGHDWCIVKLARPCVVRGLEFDTRFFTGNNVPGVCVEGAFFQEGEDAEIVAARRKIVADALSTAACKEAEMVCGLGASPAEVAAARDFGSDRWETLLVPHRLLPGVEETRRSFFHIQGGDDRVVTHLRINCFPDGGIARLRVYAEPVLTWTAAKAMSSSSSADGVEFDVAAMVNGGCSIACSDAHYGRASNLIAPGRAAKMDEGWETARTSDRPPFVLAVPPGEGKEGGGGASSSGGEHKAAAAEANASAEREEQEREQEREREQEQELTEEGAAAALAGLTAATIAVCAGADVRTAVATGQATFVTAAMQNAAEGVMMAAASALDANAEADESKAVASGVGVDFGSADDWVIIRLAAPTGDDSDGAVCDGAFIESVLVDTLHFKGNFPHSFLLEGVNTGSSPSYFLDGRGFVETVASGSGMVEKKLPWTTIVSRSELGPHRERRFDVADAARGQTFTHVRMTIFPDGGVSRLRIFGGLKIVH